MQTDSLRRRRLGVRGPDRALELADMSASEKAATCRRTAMSSVKAWLALWLFFLFLIVSWFFPFRLSGLAKRFLGAVNGLNR
jgi:hypothetical protein